MPKLDTDLAPLLRLLLRAYESLHAADLTMLREPSDQALSQLDAAARLAGEFECVFMEACRGRGIELPVRVGAWVVRRDGLGGLAVGRDGWASAPEPGPPP